VSLNAIFRDNLGVGITYSTTGGEREAVLNEVVLEQLDDGGELIERPIQNRDRTTVRKFYRYKLNGRYNYFNVPIQFAVPKIVGHGSDMKCYDALGNEIIKVTTSEKKVYHLAYLSRRLREGFTQVLDDAGSE